MNELQWQNAKIERAFLGIEDHGLFAWTLTFSGNGWGQGCGTRIVTPEAIPTLKSIVSKFGAWNKLPGTLVQVGRVGEYGPIVAMRDISNEEKAVRFEP